MPENKPQPLVTKVGNLGVDPELKFTPQGSAVANFTLAVNNKIGDKRTTTWYRVTAWEKAAENVVATLHTGDRVIVYGRPSVHEWTGEDGKTRSEKRISAWNIGVDLSWASAIIAKNVREEPVESEQTELEPF